MIKNVRINSGSKETATSTRDAVETAIDMRKRDHSLTWEGSLAKSKDRISPWKVDTSKKDETLPFYR